MLQHRSPRVTTPNEDHLLPKETDGAQHPTCLVSSSAIGTTVSRQTMYRRLRHIGLYARRSVRCVALTATHCRSLEKRACIVDSTTVVLCDVFRIVQSVTMTGHIYRDVILEQHVRMFRSAMGAEFLFMDDNARPHRANIIDECLQSG
ncbi:transposable element Tcb1 transposase [Trichonephila clavipes]|nr:transposable element Tcb1 transposase [Trichonephila clavipes]